MSGESNQQALSQKEAFLLARVLMISQEIIQQHRYADTEITDIEADPELLALRLGEMFDRLAKRPKELPKSQRRGI